MGLLPSISSVLSIGLEGGPAALVWGWILASILSFVLVQVLHFLKCHPHLWRVILLHELLLP